jgi:hypothetical protein
MKKTLCYYALYDHTTLKGVHNKIKATVQGFNSKGINSIIYGFENSDNPSFLKMVLSIIFSKYNFIIIRSVSYYNLFLIPSIIIARLRGTYVIIDIPTPFKSALVEIRNLNTNKTSSFIKIISTMLGGILISFTSNLLLSYGDDFKVFDSFFKKKNLMVSNFLNDEMYPIRKKFPATIDNQLNMIGVGNFSISQGYDIVLDAIKIWNSDKTKRFKVFLCLIGSGDFEMALKLKVADLEIEEFVDFKGFINFENYKNLYDHSHIAVGSIASFRKNLRFHSPIKEREYSFVGIPFISSINDIGFKDECFFRFSIEESNPLDSVLNIFNKGFEIARIKPQEINNYALNNFTFNYFFNQLSNKINSINISLF